LRRLRVCRYSIHIQSSSPLLRLRAIAVSLKHLRLDCPLKVCNTLFAGLVLAFTLIREAIALSVIAGVEPKMGLKARFFIATIMAFDGGRPGMISAATGAVALRRVDPAKSRAPGIPAGCHRADRRVAPVVAGWVWLGTFKYPRNSAWANRQS